MTVLLPTDEEEDDMDDTMDEKEMKRQMTGDKRTLSTLQVSSFSSGLSRMS